MRARTTPPVSPLATFGSRGFSMIELAVASSVVLILATIAIVSFQGFTNTRAASEAEVTLQSAFASQRTFFLNGNNHYATPEEITRVPEGVTFLPEDETSSSVGEVVVRLHGAASNELVMVMAARNGTCFALAANSEGRINFTDLRSSAPCENPMALEYLIPERPLRLYPAAPIVSPMSADLSAVLSSRKTTQ